MISCAKNGGFMEELSDIAKDLLLFLTRSEIKGLYSHMRFHSSVGWQNIQRPTYSGDPRVSAPEIKVFGKPLERPYISELLSNGYLDGSFSAVLSVSAKGFAKSAELRSETIQI